MKTIIKILLSPFRLIKWIVTFILDILASVITGVGVIIYGLSYLIKDYKSAMLVLKETIKKIVSHG